MLTTTYIDRGTETMNLKDATALVTGGSSGIGFAIAKTLTEAGGEGRDHGPRPAAADGHRQDDRRPSDPRRRGTGG